MSLSHVARDTRRPVMLQAGSHFGREPEDVGYHHAGTHQHVWIKPPLCWALC